MGRDQGTRRPGLPRPLGEGRAWPRGPPRGRKDGQGATGLPCGPPPLLPARAPVEFLRGRRGGPRARPPVGLDAAASAEPSLMPGRACAS